MSCTSSCPTPGDHESYGACLRAKGIKTLHVAKTNGVDSTRVKRFDAEIKAFRDADRQGIQPDGSSMAQIQKAVRISEQTGVAYKSTV